jgi:hypothetical protein
LNPRYPLASFHLGQALEGKGRVDEARQAYQTFLDDWREADDNVPEVRMAQEKLRWQSARR